MSPPAAYRLQGRRETLSGPCPPVNRDKAFRRGGRSYPFLAVEPASQGHYFQPEPQAASRPGRVALRWAGRDLELEADAGVFSARQLDPGTAVLLDHLGPVPPAGALVDLGCGYGPISVALALTAPQAEVWGVDVNQRALDLVRRNAAALGLANVLVGEGTGPAPETTLAGLWSNPPIRIGKPALHALLSSWLDRLAPGARARLVVHKHLGSDSLARWLEGEGFPTDRVTSIKGYRVLEVAARSPEPPTTDPRHGSAA
jgi:16S rRNA (guanine1207-N2)-methyltransferase